MPVGEQIDRAHIQKNPKLFPSFILHQELKRIDDDIVDCMNDPMTEYSGCGDEIGFDMRRNGTDIFLELCSRDDAEYDGDCVTESHWCPTRRP